MQELCREFRLRISVSDSESVGPDEFLTVLRQDESWRCFAQQFGWSGPSE